MKNTDAVILFLGPADSPIFEWLKSSGESVFQKHG